MRTMKSVLCVIMAAMMCLCFAACKNAKEVQNLWENATYKEDVKLGNGQKTFYTDVTADGKTVTFTVHTDKETVGEALAELGLVAGEKGPYGLYVKTVNGMSADYDKNQAYWAFNKKGESLLTGVDGEKITAGGHYELVYTK